MPLSKSVCRAAVLLTLAHAPAVRAAPEGKPWGACPAAIRDLVDRADRVTRGNSSRGEVSMKVYKRGTMSLRMKIWSQGREKFLARIVRPSRLSGSATLKSGDNLWNYLPRIDRVVKLGSSMMGSNWMGSHFTNDDLVKETDLRRHYSCESQRKEGRSVIVTLRPRPNAPVVWGKLLMKIDTRGPLPQWAKYYDERGHLKRTLFYQDVKQLGGRRVPTRLLLQPADAPSERTELLYHALEFDIDIPASTFTLRGLKR